MSNLIAWLLIGLIIGFALMAVFWIGGAVLASISSFVYGLFYMLAH